MSEKSEKIVDTKDKDLPKADALLKEARDRFSHVENYERNNREEALDDLRMLAGIDHWPAKVRSDREIDNRPVLTINKLPSFADRVLNDARLNEISIKIKPYGSGATREVADTMNGLIRNIENMSDADVAYQTALEGAVNNGFGYFRVKTTFTDDTSFDQEITIERIRNPMTVYLDHNHVTHDGRDCRFGFITEMISRGEYKARYPGVKDVVPFAEAGEEFALWVEEDRVRIAEYWVKEPAVKRLALLSDGRTVDEDEWVTIADDLQLAHKAAMEEYQTAMANIPPPDPTQQGQPQGPPPPPPPTPPPEVVRRRTINSYNVVQYLIDGGKIIEGPTKWLGKFIPIVPVWGRELIINDERFLRGLIRFAKDPQRMYNYFRTAATETVALAPKAPYVVEEEQIEGNEEDWASVNRRNLPYLKYKNVPGVPPPMRQVVTQTAIGEITEANISNDEMKSTTSLHDPSLGAQGNETSGRAILARQRMGDIANFVFHDNLKRAIKYAGDIMVDLIPRIYDTMRQVAIIKDDGEDEMMMVNQVAYDAATGKKVIINDLTLGRYKVVASVGPSFNTAREEASQSMMDFVRVAPQAALYVIDLIAEAQDWKGAVKIANRLRKAFLPPGIDDEGPPPPPEPNVDDIFKEQKIEGTMLGNIKKKLDIVEKKRELTGQSEEMVRAGAQGALAAFGIGGENE